MTKWYLLSLQVGRLGGVRFIIHASHEDWLFVQPRVGMTLVLYLTLIGRSFISPNSAAIPPVVNNDYYNY